MDEKEGFSLKQFKKIGLYVPIALGLFLLIFIQTACAHYYNRPPVAFYTLQNSSLKVTFDRNGIQKIYDKRLDKTYGFSIDSFSVTINGNTLKREGMRLMGIRREGDKLSYTWDSDNFNIVEVFKVGTGWRFVSKQLFITPQHSGSFNVNKVRLVDEKLLESISGTYVPHTRYKHSGAKDYGVFLRFNGKTGMMALVQNPFLQYEMDGDAFSLSYNPQMEWKAGYGPFTTDIACIGTYALKGGRIPVHMVPEWKWTGGKNPGNGDFEYQSEVKAFTNCVNRFVLDHMPRPLNVQVGWTENDYQIDVSTASGRDVYKRIIKRASQMGAKYLLYQPTNSLLGNYLEASDDWHVEDRLWLGMGIKIRKNLWNPRFDSLPSSVRTLLDYAKKNNVKLIAYVYPILPFSTNKNWLVNVRQNGHLKQYANLGDRDFQNWLISELSAFKTQTGIGGYSFDYTFLTLPGKSTYAQWYGWRRVMETLRKHFPDIVMDGRQLYQDYGPWIWLAGSYPHPTGTDEQPESFVPFPDLHIDRVSADRERYTAYRYRINEYCPQVLMPGFIGHQTDRYNDKGEHIREPFRRRDWDYLGWKYSLISSIAYAGLNNVINMIPARDPEEYRLFPKKDISFFKGWLAWTRTNRKYLEHTMPILGQPEIGKVDGTSAILNSKGFIFLVNPNGRSMTAQVKIDESTGFNKRGKYIVSEEYPDSGRLIGKTGEGFWNFGDDLGIQMDGSRAKVLKIVPVSSKIGMPLLFNVDGKARVKGHTLTLTGVRGETGTGHMVWIHLPGIVKIRHVMINGNSWHFKQRGQIISLHLRFAGTGFHHMQEVGRFNPTFTGGIYKANFTIPKRIFKQLKTRRQAYPIPWSKADYDTPWLVPQRLLLFVQIAQPSDTMNVTLKLNGKQVSLTKAYSSVRPYKRDFVGFYADCSHLHPETPYAVELQLPKLMPGQFQGLFFENITTAMTSALKTR